MRAAGLLYGNDLHYLDHLAPLCSLLEIPLFVTEESIKDLCQDYYQNLEAVYKNYHVIADELTRSFDVLFHCSARPFFDQIFFLAQKLYNKKMHTIWCPHGNSDKGWSLYFMEALKHEVYALLYGDKMIDFLREKNVLRAIKNYAIIGNYRKLYFDLHKPFYDRVLQKKISSRLQKNTLNILYAPTWNDGENSSSFFDAFPLLAKNLPDDFSLIVKLHPNLRKQNSKEIEKELYKYEDHSRILFLEDFPAIYPLLAFTDIYLGDASSIGYDFLFFNKPMFFLNQNLKNPISDPGAFLYRCGVVIEKNQYLDTFKIINAFLPSDEKFYEEIRKKIELYTFKPIKSKSELKSTVEELYQSLPDRDLNFF
ncbi:MAG: hypothetical protein EBZ47_04985 [Chlamydiae bacterium]|nr:hypothetical protein [Chlamydiota bacterium]